MKIIGITGLIGSGKDAVSQYLAEKYGYEVIGMGDIVREISREIGRTNGRDDLQKTQKEIVEKYGWEYFAEHVVKKILKNKWNKVVINGIRRPQDAIVPKKHFGKNIVILLIDAPPKVRYERLKQRKREGDPETFEEFMRQEKNEIKLFNIEETLKYYDHKIENTGDVKKLYKTIDEFMKKKNLA